MKFCVPCLTACMGSLQCLSSPRYLHSRQRMSLKWMQCLSVHISTPLMMGVLEWTRITQFSSLLVQPKNNTMHVGQLNSAIPLINSSLSFGRLSPQSPPSMCMNGPIFLMSPWLTHFFTYSIQPEWIRVILSCSTKTFTVSSMRSLQWHKYHPQPFQDNQPKSNPNKETITSKEELK